MLRNQNSEDGRYPDGDKLPAPRKFDPMVSIISGEPLATRAVAPSVDSSLGAKLLPGVLSVTAGSVDVISFLGLGGLFAAHITGNLVILAAHIVTGRAASLALILSVPVFITVLALTRLVAAGLEETGHGSLRPLLALQFVLLVSLLAVGVAAGSGLNPAAPTAVVAGMLGSLRWRCRTRSRRSR
jgi:Protein of unknown function (DUF1275)